MPGEAGRLLFPCIGPTGRSPRRVASPSTTHPVVSFIVLTLWGRLVGYFPENMMIYLTWYFSRSWIFVRHDAGGRAGVLRRKRPDWWRPDRTLGLPYRPAVVFLIGRLIYCFSTALERPREFPQLSWVDGSRTSFLLSLEEKKWKEKEKTGRSKSLHNRYLLAARRGLV